MRFADSAVEPRDAERNADDLALAQARRGLKQVRQRVVEALHQIVRAVRLDFKACIARKDVVDAASAHVGASSVWSHPT